MEKRNYFRGDAWFNEKVAERTWQAIVRLDQEFELEHMDDTDEELLNYVRECAKRLGHTPHPVEIFGGNFICRRFKGWNKLIVAGLLPPVSTTPPSPERCEIYKMEYRRQARLFKKEREAAKELRAQKQRANSACALDELRARTLRDLEWGLEHEKDTDEELLDYVRKCAEEMGRSPRLKDVFGGIYIQRRFGSWGMVLTIAGLKLPRDVKEPKPSAVKAYWKSKENKCGKG